MNLDSDPLVNSLDGNNQENIEVAGERKLSLRLVVVVGVEIPRCQSCSLVVSTKLRDVNPKTNLRR